LVETASSSRRAYDRVVTNGESWKTAMAQDLVAIW